MVYNPSDPFSYESGTKHLFSEHKDKFVIVNNTDTVEQTGQKLGDAYYLLRGAMPEIDPVKWEEYKVSKLADGYTEDAIDLHINEVLKGGIPLYYNPGTASFNSEELIEPSFHVLSSKLVQGIRSGVIGEMLNNGAETKESNLVLGDLNNGHTYHYLWNNAQVRSTQFKGVKKILKYLGLDAYIKDLRFDGEVRGDWGAITDNAMCLWYRRDRFTIQSPLVYGNKRNVFSIPLPNCLAPYSVRGIFSNASLDIRNIPREGYPERYSNLACQLVHATGTPEGRSNIPIPMKPSSGNKPTDYYTTTVALRFESLDLQYSDVDTDEHPLIAKSLPQTATESVVDNIAQWGDHSDATIYGKGRFSLLTYSSSLRSIGFSFDPDSVSLTERAGEFDVLNSKITYLKGVMMTHDWANQYQALLDRELVSEGKRTEVEDAMNEFRSKDNRAIKGVISADPYFYTRDIVTKLPLYDTLREGDIRLGSLVYQPADPDDPDSRATTFNDVKNRLNKRSDKETRFHTITTLKTEGGAISENYEDQLTDLLEHGVFIKLWSRSEYDAMLAATPEFWENKLPVNPPMEAKETPSGIYPIFNGATDVHANFCTRYSVKFFNGPRLLPAGEFYDICIPMEQAAVYQGKEVDASHPDAVSIDGFCTINGDEVAPEEALIALSSGAPLYLASLIGRVIPLPDLYDVAGGATGNPSLFFQDRGFPIDYSHTMDVVFQYFFGKTVSQLREEFDGDGAEITPEAKAAAIQEAEFNPAFLVDPDGYPIIDRENSPTGRNLRQEIAFKATKDIERFEALIGEQLMSCMVFNI